MLTEEQAETISQPDENKLICALPGSGKTHTFISLVDRILDVDLTYRVLMVTFTNASAKEMEERVSNRLGKTKAKRVRAATFASLMLGQFRAIANRRKAVIGPEQTSFVRRALNQLNIPYDDLDAWVSKIDDMGRELHLEDDGTPSYKVFLAYNDMLTKYKRFDLNMMARELVIKMDNGTLAPYPYTHILCDEFQDTDNLQYEWLAAHGRKGKKLAVVGDDDQSIYSWRGSMGYHAFVKFQKDFSAAGYLLSLCFRCKGNILHSAKAFIENNTDRIHKDMRSIAEGEGVVKLITIPKGYQSEFLRNLQLQDKPEALVKALEKNTSNKDKGSDDDMERFRFVVERIKQSGETGWAVLARTNKQLDDIEQAFSEMNIDTVRIGGKSIFDNEHAIGIISLLLALADRRAIAELATGLGWIGESEDNIKELYTSAQLYGFGGAQLSSSRNLSRSTEYFRELAQKADHVTESNANKFIEQFFKAIHRVIEVNQDMERSLQTAVADVCKLIALNVKGSLQDKARTLFQRSQKNKAKKDIKNPNVVVLATMNGSKGLEWPRVWIIEVEKKKVPMLKEETQEALEEERRLLYVAMTRAEEELYLSYRENKESQFIEEIAGCVI